MGGLPAWVLVRRKRWIVALSLTIAASALPVMLLIAYGDSSVPSLMIQIVVLGLFAYGLACLGMAMGRRVWLP